MDSNNKNNLSIGSIISESWLHRNEIASPVLWLALKFIAIMMPLIILMIVAVVYFIMTADSNVGRYSDPTDSVPSIIYVGFYVLSAYISTKYFTVPLIMLGVRKSIGLPTELSLVKKECNAVHAELIYLILAAAYIPLVFHYLNELVLGDSPPLMTYIIASIISYLIVFVIVTPIKFFAIPLAITRKTSAKKSLSIAYDKMTDYWLPALGASIVFAIIAFLYTCGVIILLMAVTFVIGLISKVLSILVAIPLLIYTAYMLYIPLFAMWAILVGVIFREVFGLQKIQPKTAIKAPEPPPPADDEPTVEAPSE